jgi:uncharacterized protein DUF4256
LLPTQTAARTDMTTSLKPKERDALLGALKKRFEQNMRRHPGVEWADVLARLQDSPEKLASLHEMEKTGGEPDVIGAAGPGGGYVFCDCAAESPAGRRSVCYDREGLESRKENRPQDNAVDMAQAMGVAILDEAQYRELQKFGDFDAKSSSWIETPADIRRLGGALFCDRRYGTVFTYHNGAQSYYAARGFRATLQV